MDKRKIINAYRRGFITMKECAQLLGLDPDQTRKLVQEPFAEQAEWSGEHAYTTRT